MPLKLNLIAAMCENRGIGMEKKLPWHLSSEMEYFTKTTTDRENKQKKNVVIMGRVTWDSIPKKYKPLKDRINFVLSKAELNLKDYNDAHAFKSMEAAMKYLEEDDMKDKWEALWVIGGRAIYEEAMRSEYFYRLYLTEIKAVFDCDTFFPELPDNLKRINPSGVPEGIQEQCGIEYEFLIYENEAFVNTKEEKPEEEKPKEEKTEEEKTEVQKTNEEKTEEQKSKDEEKEAEKTKEEKTEGEIAEAEETKEDTLEEKKAEEENTETTKEEKSKEE